jgi:hypothetical protein
MKRILALAAIALVGILPLTACSHSASSALRKAAASASANPAVAKAEAAAEAKVKDCVRQIGVLTLARQALHHPVAAGERVIDCAVPAPQRPAAKKCIGDAFVAGSGISTAESTIAMCIVKAEGSPAPSPKASK